MYIHVMEKEIIINHEGTEYQSLTLKSGDTTIEVSSVDKDGDMEVSIYTRS